MGRAPIGALFHAGHLLAVAGPGAAPLAGYSAGVDSLQHPLWNGHREEVHELHGRPATAAGDIGLLNGPALQPKAAHLVELREELRGYIDRIQASLVDYGQRHRAGKPISSSLAESTVNQLVNARMNKRRRMRWSPLGAHRILRALHAAGPRRRSR